MNHISSRRAFLKNCGQVALAAAVVGGGASGLAAAAGAGWPVTCRDVHLKVTGQGDCWGAMKFLGLNGVEVYATEDLSLPGLYHPTQKYSLATEEGIKTVKEAFAANGVIISAFAMNNRFDERLDQEIEWGRKLAQAAEKLGVKAIRIDVYPRKITGDAAVPFSINACKKLCDAAVGTAVRFGIENHGRFTNDPVVLEKLFDGVGSEKLGLTMDFMNFYWFGHPLEEVYKLCERFAPRAYHTHCKNLRYPEDRRNVRREVGWEYNKYSASLYDGDIDYGRMAGILLKAGYKADLCLENECLAHYPKAEHPEVLRKEIALLRKAAM